MGGGWKGPRCAAGTAGWLFGSPQRKAATSVRSAAHVGAALAARDGWNMTAGAGVEVNWVTAWSGEKVRFWVWKNGMGGARIAGMGIGGLSA